MDELPVVEVYIVMVMQATQKRYYQVDQDKNPVRYSRQVAERIVADHNARPCRVSDWSVEAAPMRVPV